MNVLLIANQHIDELLPITGDIASGLLPIAGKPLAEYVLESVCSKQNIDNITWVCGGYVDAYQQAFGDGERWGVPMDYVQDLSEVYGAYFMLRADTLLDADLSHFVAIIEKHSTVPYCARVNGLASIYWAPNQDYVAQVLNDKMSTQWQEYTFDQAKLISVNTAQHFHDANMQIIRDELPQIPVDHFQQGKALVCGARAQVDSDVLKAGRAYVGARSQLDKAVSIENDTVVGHDVIIESNAVLNNAVVFPNTFIGQWLELKNVIVNGNMLFRLDSNVCIRVNEPFLLRDLHQPEVKRKKWFGLA